MKISDHELIKLANLAKIDIDAGDRDEFLEKVTKIIEFMEIIDKFHDELGPEIPVSESAELMSLRQDVVGDSAQPNRALDIAPSISGSTFKVPRFHE